MRESGLGDQPGTRARRRGIRLAVGGAAALAVIAGVVAGIGTGVLGWAAPAGQAGASGRAGSGAAVGMAPYYLAVEDGGRAAVGRRTATGGSTGKVLAPAGLRFAAAAGGGDDRTFVLAGQNRSGLRIYRLRLDSAGQPGALRSIAVAPLAERFGDCPAQLSGLAVSQDSKQLAIAMLSNCPNGRAGPGRIFVVALPGGGKLATWRPGDGYPTSLSWTTSGILVYSWAGTRYGVWAIAHAASSSQATAPRLLIAASAGINGLTDPDYSMVAPGGSVVFATIGKDVSLAVAEFSVRTGRALRILAGPVHNPPAYCGPLWTSASGRHLLAACGDGTEAAIDNGQVTKLGRPWRLPSYVVPGGPLIAW